MFSDPIVVQPHAGEVSDVTLLQAPHWLRGSLVRLLLKTNAVLSLPDQENRHYPRRSTASVIVLFSVQQYWPGVCSPKVYGCQPNN